MKNRVPVLITLMLGTAMAALDSSIVNVSLPVIQKQFGASINGIEWVILGYMISFCLFIPLTNWLKNRIGYYNLFIISIAIFTTGSLLCSLSSNLSFLIAARIFQAIGGGAITPTSLAILTDSFPKAERGSAIGWWGIGNVMGPAIGPTLGGVLTYYFEWPSIFYINIPIGIITIIMSVFFLGFLKKQPKLKPSFDLGGYAYFGIFIVMLQLSLTMIADPSIPAWQYIAGFVVSIFFLALFIYSSKKPNPLIDLSVFKSATFINCSIIILIRSLALYGGLFFLPFLLQGLMGYSEIETGLLLLPNAAMMLLLRPYAGKLADQGIIRNPSIVGIVLITVSMAEFAFMDSESHIWIIILAMAIRGFGMSLLVSPVSTSLLNSISPGQTATATSINSLLQQVGGSVGIAISGILHTYISRYYLGLGRASEVAEHFALQDGFLISGIIIAFAIIPALKLPNRNNVAKLTADKLTALR